MRKLTGAALAAGLLTVGMVGSTVAQPPADTEGTVKVFMRDSGEFVLAAERATAQFAEMYPNVTVEINHTPVEDWGSYTNSLVNQIAAGDAPDVIEIAIEGFLAVSSQDLVIDLRELLENSTDGSLDDISPNLLTRMESPQTGELNWFPTDWNNILIYYNKDMFDEAGVAYPEDGWTWDEFLETAKALTVTDESGNTSQFGYRIPGFNFGVTPWFLTNNTDKLNDDWTESNVTDPAFAESMAFLKSLIDAGASPTYSAGVGDQEFTAKQVAMFSCGHWCVPGVEAAGLENVGVVYPPVPNEGDELKTVFGIGGLGVAKSASNPELALEFAKVFAGDDFQNDLATARFSIPTSRSYAADEAFLAYPDGSERFYGSADDDRILPIASPPNFAQMEGIFNRHLENYLTGNTDLESAISELDSKLSRAMERAYR
jgi:multiple sugar transport system substrate-binding protein